MFVTTHALIASTIAIKTGNPYIYLPAGIGNHFLLDMIPHFGLPKDMEEPLKSRLFTGMIFLDVLFGTLTFLLLIKLFSLNPIWLFGLCLLAGWPDLVSLFERVAKKGWKPLLVFHERIQPESYAGIVVELLLIAACWYILLK